MTGDNSILFRLKIDAESVSAAHQVYAVTVSSEANRIPWAKITILDGDAAKGDFISSNSAIFAPGKEIELYVFYKGAEYLLFKGIIVKHSISARQNGHSQLRLECRDKGFKMTLETKSRYFTSSRDSEIALELTRPYALEPEIENTAIEHLQLVQHDLSDWDFLLNRMDLNGKVVLLSNGKMKVLSPNLNAEPVLTLRYGRNILDFDAEIDARTQFTKVEAISWDYSEGEPSKAEARPPGGNQEAGNLSSSDLANAVGAKLATLRYASRASSQELQTAADAWLQRSRLAKIRGRARCHGDPAALPGTMIKLEGLGERFNGKVWVSGVRHEIASGDWTTDIQFGLDPEWIAAKFSPSAPGAGIMSSVQGLHTGIVTQLGKDPEGEDRILVKLPSADFNNDGIWARVATLDAGNQRGSFFRPDIGDEVIVGFLQNDPREAVVLGMLHSSTRPAPLQAKDENKEKGFFFASKMKILFNEEDKSMSFETPAGNKFNISEKEKGITLQDQNGNKIILNADGIALESTKKMILKAAAGDIEIEGMNVSQRAQVQFKAQGGTGMEVSSSGQTQLKGAMVLIN